MCLSPLLRTTEADIPLSVAEHLGMSSLLSVATAWQSPDAAAAQAVSVSTGAECPAQESQGQTTQPGAEKPAAPLPEVLLSTGEKTKHFDPTDLAVYCTELQHIVLVEKTQFLYLRWFLCTVSSNVCTGLYFCILVFQGKPPLGDSIVPLLYWLSFSGHRDFLQLKALESNPLYKQTSALLKSLCTLIL